MRYKLQYDLENSLSLRIFWTSIKFEVTVFHYDRAETSSDEIVGQMQKSKEQECRKTWRPGSDD